MRALVLEVAFWAAPRSPYHDRDGRPIDVDRWSELLLDSRYVCVNATVEPDFEVSTIWTGDDFVAARTGMQPLIFESMVVRGPYQGVIRRYPTLAEALEGHASLVRACRAALVCALVNAPLPPLPLGGRKITG